MDMFPDAKALLDSGYLFRITDNGGATFDRFTIIYCDGDYLGASEMPSHPQGFGQHGERIDVSGVEDRVEEGRERDLRWIDLPEAVRRCVLVSLNQGFRDYLEAAPACATREDARDWQGLWSDRDRDGKDVGPIYVNGDGYSIRDDEHDGGDAPTIHATFRDAVYAMLPQDYDLSGSEYHSGVNLADETRPAKPLWDHEKPVIVGLAIIGAQPGEQAEEHIGDFATEDEAVEFLSSDPSIDRVRLEAGDYSIDLPQYMM